MANSSLSTCDVLVVGAGPVGLTLALELYRRGVACRIIDQQPGPARTSRALGTHARTLELFQAMGIIDTIRAHSQPVNHFSVYEHGRRLIVFDLDIQQSGTPFTASLFIGQAETEHILRSHLRSLGGNVEYATRITAFSQDNTGVTATLINNGTEEHIRVSWLVGCDGGHSSVRKFLQLPFEGASDETWLVADVEIDWRMPTDSIHMFRSPEGTVVAFPFPQQNKWRLLDTVTTEIPDASEAEVATIFTRKIAATLHQPVQVHTPDWLSRFTIQQRKVPTMRVGHCFLAGDAAHVHSPASGQGMSIQDAYNLAWKLALVVQGHAQDILLDSYNAEREPVAARALRGALTSTRLLQPRSPLIKRAGSTIVRQLGRIEPVRRLLSARIARGITALGLNYATSPIVAEDVLAPRTIAHNPSEYTISIPAAFTFSKGLLPGSRVPDMPVQIIQNGPAPSSLFDVLKDIRHTLLLFPGSQSSPEQQASIMEIGVQVQQHYRHLINPMIVLASEADRSHLTWQGTVLLDNEHTLQKHFGAVANCLYLIRPDGYIGYRSQPATTTALFTYLQENLHLLHHTFRNTRRDDTC